MADLAVRLNQAGDVAMAQKDSVAAAKAYGESLAICRKLAAWAPNSAGAQADVAYTLARLGGAEAATGDAAGAQKNLADALTIQKSLAAAYPTSASLPASGVRWADVVAYLEGVKAKGMLMAGDDKWLDIYRQRAAKEAGK